MNRLKIGAPESQIFWFLNKPKAFRRCSGTIKTDIVIVGGGMAGLSAAQAFRQRGLSVVLLEQYACGSGASGKSSGFITANSEIDLAHLKRRYGIAQAHKIWEFVSSGVQLIQDNIKQYSLACDYKVQESLILANDMAGVKAISLEHQARLDSHYPSKLYAKEELGNVISSSKYEGAQRYGGSFGINAHYYCQEMKKVLDGLGAQIYEETSV
jgi:gamma-glutamylputrescine oxidase